MCSLQVPPCQKCGGILKPDVTFFGDNVSRAKVEFVFEQVDSCDSLLVAGSSLFVSNYRILTNSSCVHVEIVFAHKNMNTCCASTGINICY